jgi:hypothetical protein
MTPYHTDLGVMDDQEVAHLVIREHPEIVACLDGLQFDAGEGALLTLLLASVRNSAEKILMDVRDEEDIPESIFDVEDRAKRVGIAAKAIQWELQNQGDPHPDSRARSAAYHAEALELLHGPPPVIELSAQEREVLVRRAAASLEQANAEDHAEVGTRRRELQVLLDDLALLQKSDFPLFVTKLSVPRLCAWMARWNEDLYGKGPDASSELAVLRTVWERLKQSLSAKNDGSSISEGEGTILPRGL